MHVLIFIGKNGEQAVVSARKQSLRQYIQAAKRNSWVWRYHDGNGWADGSVDAWKDINSITGIRSTNIVY